MPASPHPAQLSRIANSRRYLRSQDTTTITADNNEATANTTT